MPDRKIAELRALAARVVSAYVYNNSVSSDLLGGLITTVYDSLRSAETDASVEVQEAANPAVSIKKSIGPDAIICLDCGKPMKMLKRHLATEHRLSVADYKAKWHLASDYPVVAPNYASARSEMAKKIGLGHKPKARPGRKPKAS